MEKSHRAIDPILNLALEAQSKFFIEELDKRFKEYNDKWENRISESRNPLLPTSWI